MSDDKNIAETPPEEQISDLEAGTEQVFFDVLVSGDEAGVRTLIAELHPADAADLLERLGADERARVVEILRDDFEPKILSELDETVRDHVIECLGVENLAAVIAEKSPMALRLAKEAVLTAFETPLATGLEFERRNLALAFDSDDQEEGMRAFVEKRQPRFRGT